VSAPALGGRRPLRLGPVSTVRRPRAALAGGGLAVLAVLLLALDVGLGDFPISVPDVLRVLVGGGEQADRFIVLELRLPRALTGVLVGLALGVAGAITQSVARNPLASPDVLGITAGAGVGAVALIVLAGGSLGGGLAWVGRPVAALAAGTLTAVAVHALAWRRGVSGFRFVLVGIAVASLMASVTSYLLIVADLNEAAQAAVWLTGSLNGRGWEHVVPVGLAVAAAAVAALVTGPTLAALRMGEDTARALGVRLQRGQTGQLGIAVALASVATASAGPIAFLGLIAPQVAQRLSRTPGPPVLLGGLVGAVLLLAADVVSRTLLPAELPVGVLTAVIGAPYLIALLVRRTRRSP
jgi:iron complex transport system permease protein